MQNGTLVQNKLSNGSIVICRVIEFIESVGMYRLTDARETRPDAWLISHNRTWAAPLENIQPVDGPVQHTTGLVTLGSF